VKHRLTHVGWSGDPEFDTTAFNAVFEHTNGVPRRINTLCNRVMLSAYLTECHLVGAADVESVVSEIKEELGDEVPPGAVLTATDPVFRAMRGDNYALSGLHSDGAHESRAPSSSAEGSVGMIGVKPAASLEGRLERLEKAMVAALNAIHRLVKPEQQQAPSQAPSQTPQQTPTRKVNLDVEL
jgi:hypothetical protein